MWTLNLAVLGATAGFFVTAVSGRDTAPTFQEDVAFLEKHGPLHVLSAPGRGARVAVSAKYQGRVMTSAVEAAGRSLGWINRAFIEAGRTGTAFDNYGGEDRFWLGPEGGQYALFFAPGAPFALPQWRTPAAMQEGAWTVKEAAPAHVVFTRRMALANASGAKFDVEVERRVELLPDRAVEDRLDVDLTPSWAAGTQWVAFETVNRITNRGSEPWTKEKGLVSVWILGMFPPSPDTYVVVPFETAGTGPIVEDGYFGKVPPSRLSVREKEGYILFKGDGAHRSKIGVGPARARNVLGSYAAASRVLTVTQFDKPSEGREYVNSLWEVQKAPYAGDVVNSYNDGPVPGQPALPPFYELETSSPAAALKPGESLVHTHRTFHFVGDRAALDTIATRVLGVSATRIARGIR